MEDYDGTYFLEEAWRWNYWQLRSGYIQGKVSLIGFCIRWLMQGVILGSIALLFLLLLRGQCRV